MNLNSRLLSLKKHYHQNYVITIVLYLVLCKMNHNPTQHLFKFKHLFLNQNLKFSLMNFKFEFLNIHISHLTQLWMINITFKCQNKKVKKFTIFTTIWHVFWTLFLYPHPKKKEVWKNKKYPHKCFQHENTFLICVKVWTLLIMENIPKNIMTIQNIMHH